MMFFMKFNYPWSNNLYHKVEGAGKTREECLRNAIHTFVRGTKISASKVKVWSARGFPKKIAGLTERDKEYIAMYRKHHPIRKRRK